MLASLLPFIFWPHSALMASLPLTSFWILPTPASAGSLPSHLMHPDCKSGPGLCLSCSDTGPQGGPQELASNSTPRSTWLNQDIQVWWENPKARVSPMLALSLLPDSCQCPHSSVSQTEHLVFPSSFSPTPGPSHSSFLVLSFPSVLMWSRSSPFLVWAWAVVPDLPGSFQSLLLTFPTPTSRSCSTQLSAQKSALCSKCHSCAQIPSVTPHCLQGKKPKLSTCLSMSSTICHTSPGLTIAL